MNQQANFGKLFLRPLVAVVIVAAVVFGLVIGMGEWLLAATDHSVDRSSLARRELWVAIIPSAIVVALAWFIAYSPKGRFGFLEKTTVVGKEPFFPDPAPSAAQQARHGAPGTAANVAAGWTIYAKDAPLARVVGVVPGEAGMSYLYSNGFEGGSRQIWIPLDAVEQVYPETKSAFVSLRKTEGWTTLPRGVAKP